jgi:hypothetical protein
MTKGTVTKILIGTALVGGAICEYSLEQMEQTKARTQEYVCAPDTPARQMIVKRPNGQSMTLVCK